eukprot:g5533.t1
MAIALCRHANLFRLESSGCCVRMGLSYRLDRAMKPKELPDGAMACPKCDAPAVKKPFLLGQAEKYFCSKSCGWNESRKTYYT